MSGGATFASTIAHIWQERTELPPITGVFMLNPILENEVCLHGSKKLLFESAYNSKKTNSKAPVLDQAMTDRFWSKFSDVYMDTWISSKTDTLTLIQAY